jgi:two-component system chemotaxis response regulator CheY
MKKILVVDDSSTMRKIIRRTLRQTGLAFDDVLEAENGIEALSVLASDPAIRVVLSDINMPEMNGIELVTQLRTQHDASVLGVVMVTTEGGEAMVKTAMERGANGYVTKPFTPDAIKDALEVHLG